MFRAITIHSYKTAVRSELYQGQHFLRAARALHLLGTAHKKHVIDIRVSQHLIECFILLSLSEIAKRVPFFMKQKLAVVPFDRVWIGEHEFIQLHFDVAWGGTPYASRGVRFNEKTARATY